MASVTRGDTANVGADGTVVVAVNSCIRKYAAHLGIYARDTIRFVSGKPLYALSASFIEDGITAKPFVVYAISLDSGKVYGYERIERPSDMGSATESAKRLFDVRDDHLWISKAENLDLISVYGPIAGITMTDGADTTNVLEQDRSAICDCATALVADQLGPNMSATASSHWAKFEAHIIARGGSAPTRGGP